MVKVGGYGESKKRSSSTMLGLLFGAFIGLLASALLYNYTGDAVYYGLLPLAAIVGLVAGVLLDRKEKRAQ